MKIKQLDPINKNDVKQWVQFPFDLYKGDSTWVPPLRSGAATLMDISKHPFYEHSEAAFFVAEDGETTLARVCVFENKNYNKHNNDQAAFFGYFESIDDVNVGRALFDAASGWAKERGLDKLYGPKELISSSAGGLMVEGFEHHQVIDTPYNPPYYDGLLKELGFEKHRDTLSGYGERANYEVPERVMRISERAAQRSGFTVRSFRSKKELWELPPIVMDIHDRSFGEIPEHTPQTLAEVNFFTGQMIDIAIPEQVKLVLKDEKPVGFIISYPDVSEGLKKAKGRLFPFGWWHILQAKKNTEWIIFNGVGVLPEHQGRGANAVMYVELIKTVLANEQYQFAETVHIGEENARSLADQESMGATWYKRYRVYWKRLDK